MGILDSRKALITGASGGIGRAIAARLATDGAAVACHGVPWEPADEIVEELTGQGHQAVAVCGNLMEDDATTAAVNEAASKLGGLDIVVNNAGVTKDTLIVKMDEEAWDLVLGVNLMGAVTVTEAALSALKASGDGRIINMASVVGLMGNAGQANYGASKAGLITLTKVWARRLAPDGIKANAIAPGFIQTRMTADLPEKARAALSDQIPLTRLGEPEDVAGVCAFLSGPDSTYLTGQVLGVDGGMVMT
jgi:3-oxoacyl-[acyl-carrier protein] reductase